MYWHRLPLEPYSIVVENMFCAFFTAEASQVTAIGGFRVRVRSRIESWVVCLYREEGDAVP